VSQKPIREPVWYRNSYFWIAAILLILSILAIAMGQGAIRDPGQKREGGLWFWYLLACVVMAVNGWISHAQAMQAYREAVASGAVAPSKKTSSGPAAELAVDTPENPDDYV
jgi:drug/metabolite transporter (DMT)-like permease